MADNAVVDNGDLSDVTVATDEVDLGSGVGHVQYMKIVDGDFGGTTPAKVALGGLIVGGIRRDADTTPAADGAGHPLYTDESGRVKASVFPASQAATTGAIVAAAGTVVADVSRTSNIVVHVTGVFTGHNVTFEGSIDGATWFGVQAVRTNANTIETVTGSMSAVPAYAWELSVNGLVSFRVRATTHTSGTATWRIQPAPFATEPIPAAQASTTQPISGSLSSAGTTTATPATPSASVVNSAASTNGTVVKASAGTVYSVTVSNTAGATRYLKLHNSTSVTPGSTAVAVTIPVTAGQVLDLNFGALGMRFTTGICLSITGAAADTDTTAVGASEVKVLTSYL